MESNETTQGLPPAGFWVRAAALLLDGVFLFIILLVAGIPVAILVPILGAMVGTSSPLVSISLFVTYFGIPCLYFTICTSVWGGTLGKQAFNLRVVRLDGGRVPFLVALWRWVSYFFSLAVLGIGYMMAGFTQEKRGLHDLTAGTRVVAVKPANEVAVILTLVLIPFVGLAVGGIVAAIAIPKFAQMLEKSREGATKANVLILKQAVEGYKAANGKWPKDLQKDLVPDYLDEIPQVKVTGAFDGNVMNNKPTGSGVKVGKPSKIGRDGSGWLYDPTFGRVYVNSTLTDSKAVPYSFYGYE